MAAFRVTLTADAYMAATIEVYGTDDPAEAKQIAIISAQGGNVIWNYQGIIEGTIEAQEVTQ